ncbi:MAG: hypothetical protein QCI82_06670 [Candidatus Thermoplasmatota archaeon]|nr:hypothetical protein [Candidatus Thermoplasmatota archaeon]
MKVMARSYAFPAAIFVMGVLMIIGANLEITVRNSGYQLILGGVLMCLGFLLWAIPELDRSIKRRERLRQRREAMRSPRTPPSRR